MGAQHCLLESGRRGCRAGVPPPLMLARELQGEFLVSLLGNTGILLQMVKNQTSWGMPSQPLGDLVSLSP